MTKNSFEMKSFLVRDIQRRNPFQIEYVPWIDKVYSYPVDHYSSLARQALFGAPNFLLFWLYRKIIPIIPRGTFHFKLDGCDRQIIFDGRNTQFSALYFKAYSAGYEAHTAALIDLLVPSDGVFLDIGSNWGWFSLFVSSKAGFHGQVHAFEPFPSSFQDLRSIVSQAGLAETVNCHEVALSDQAGEVSMFLPDKFQSGQAIMQEKKSTGRTRIRSQTLDSLALQKISMIKMDVEGSEAKVIRGATQTLARCRPMIVMENGRHFSEIKKTLDPLFLLRDLGYLFFHIGWRRKDQGKYYFLGDDDDSNPQKNEQLCLVPFIPEERFLRANGMNVFACHQDRTDVIQSLFLPVDCAQSLSAKV